MIAHCDLQHHHPPLQVVVVVVVVVVVLAAATVAAGQRQAHHPMQSLTTYNYNIDHEEPSQVAVCVSELSVD
jgi:hypothetical protein